MTCFNTNMVQCKECKGIIEVDGKMSCPYDRHILTEKEIGIEKYKDLLDAFASYVEASEGQDRK